MDELSMETKLQHSQNSALSILGRVGGVLGGLVATVFCLGVFCLGAWITGTFGIFFLELVAPYQWRPVPHQIVSTAEKEYRPHKGGVRKGLELHFQYEYRGQTYATNGWVSLGSDGSKHAHIKKRYSAGSWGRCYVNPKEPREVTLRPSSLWNSLVFIAVMVVASLIASLGVGGIYVAVRGTIYYLFPRSSPVAAPPGWATTPAAPWLLKVALGGLFLAAAILFYLSCVEPALRVAGARKWVKTPCVVVFNSVDKMTGLTSHGATVVYRYEVAAQFYLATRYGFSNAASDNSIAQAIAANRFQPDTETFCYVHPGDPTETVLDRGFSADLWWGLLPLAGMALTAWGWNATRLSPRPAWGRPARRRLF